VDRSLADRLLVIAAARLLPSAAVQQQHWINSDAVEDAKRLGYDIVTANAVRRANVRGFRVLWALDDTDALGV
jgi:hypothetical protein